MRNEPRFRTSLLAWMLALSACQAPPDAAGDFPLELDQDSQALTSAVAPAADAYVRDGSNAGTNFGTRTTMEVKTQASAGNTRWGYLRFPLTTVSGTVTNAKLRLYGSRPAAGPVSDSVFAVASNTWTETGINWNNRPALGAAQGPGVTVGTAAAYHEWDVTPFVSSQKTAGATAVSLAIKMDSAITTGPDVFNTREASGNRPELVITTSTGTNAAPTVARAASAIPNPAPAKDAALSVLGADDAGEGALTYTWATVGTPPAPVTYSVNGNNAAKNAAVFFTKAGTYQFQVTIRDVPGLTATSSVTVVVNQTLTTIAVTPSPASVPVGGTQQFTGTARDQFGDVFNISLAFAWSVSGGGSINSSGLFTAGSTPGGPFTVTAALDGKSGTAPVTVVSGAVTLNPQADAYVRDGTSAGTNFGTATTLVVKTQTGAGNTRVSYLRFPLASVSSVGSATLRLYGTRVSANPVGDGAYAVASNTWTETGITFNNRPALGALQGAPVVVTTTARYYEWDVSAFVRAQKSAGATAVSLAVRMDGEVTIGPDTFNSKEASSNKPQLVVTAGSSSADRDGDRLNDNVETNTGVFRGASDTGTNPDNPDTDGDGILDGDEVLGTTQGLNLPAMGTNPLHRDVLLEHDWLADATDCGTHSHRPTALAIAKVVEAFATAPVSNPDGRPGINLINDYGQGGAFTGGNQIADADGLIDGGFGDDYQSKKNPNFAANRAGYFHYVLNAHLYTDILGSSGLAEIRGDDMIVSLGCAYGEDQFVANTIMHELGHNLNLHHGGDVPDNNKPNYNSVMNYNYQFSGVDNNCTPPGDNVLSYSTGVRNTLDENALNERLGICGGVPWDWNNSGFIEATLVTAEINFDDFRSVLTDYNDWANLVYDWDAPGIASVSNVVSCPPPPGR